MEFVKQPFLIKHTHTHRENRVQLFSLAYFMLTFDPSSPTNHSPCIYSLASPYLRTHFQPLKSNLRHPTSLRTDTALINLTFPTPSSRQDLGGGVVQCHQVA